MKRQICVVGWYYLLPFYERLLQSKFDIHIVAHRYDKILDDFNLNYTIIDNVGLEFGAYEWYIKNIWNGKSNAIFMHDDMEITKDSVWLNIFTKCKKKELDQCYIFGEKGRGPHGRCIYMSKWFIDTIKKDYGGIWYDEENIGYNHKKNQPAGWDKKRYNWGTYTFFNTVKSIEEKYNKKVVGVSMNIKGIVLYGRGKPQQ